MRHAADLGSRWAAHAATPELYQLAFRRSRARRRWITKSRRVGFCPAMCPAMAWVEIVITPRRGCMCRLLANSATAHSDASASAAESFLQEWGK